MRSPKPAAPQPAPQAPGRTEGSALEMDPAPKQRRALTHVGGAVELSGADAAVAKHLSEALQTTHDEEETRAHVHGFHSYPARLHPRTARTLIDALSVPGETVLDPFCGSGTVLVEARLAGRRALGIDVNPLSVRLSAFKCRGASAEERQRFAAAAQEVIEFAEERRVTKAGPLRMYPPEDRELFPIHILLELDSLRAGIARLQDGAARGVLQLVLSSLLVKLSHRASDTSQRSTPRRLASGFALRLFGDRTQELLQQLEAFTALLPKAPARADAAPYVVWEADARLMKPVKNGSVDLVVCSPPYPGVYDYFDHHELRLRWLELPQEGFERSEIGAKRQLERSSKNARAEWIADLTLVCRSLARVLRPGKLACLVLADCAVGGTLLLADDCLAEAARAANLEVAAGAAQRRPHFHKATERWFRDRPRREHLIALRRAKG